MTTATVWAVTLLIVGALVVIAGLQVFVAGLFPGLVGEASRRLRRSPGSIGRAFAMGLAATFIVAVVIAAIALLPGAAKLLTVPFAAAALLMLGAGLAAVSLTVGAGMSGRLDARSPSRRLVRGAVASGLAFVFPFVGWLGFLPMALFMGSGAVLCALFDGDGRRAAVAELRAP